MARFGEGEQVEAAASAVRRKREQRPMAGDVGGEGSSPVLYQTAGRDADGGHGQRRDDGRRDQRGNTASGAAHPTARTPRSWRGTAERGHLLSSHRLLFHFP
ncbi:unnamed protein product [Urochloa humidicola]